MALADGIIATANALGMDPVDLATIISFETGGTFDPMQAGPTTKWGQHRGLIQFGEPQAQQFGVDWNDPVGTQLGPEGAIARYFQANGWQPGMSGLDAYSIVNAGAPGRYSASDTAAGGTQGSVRDKWERQMGDHRAKAETMLAGLMAPQPAPATPVPPSALAESFVAGTPRAQTAAAPAGGMASAAGMPGLFAGAGGGGARQAAAQTLIGLGDALSRQAMGPRKDDSQRRAELASLIRY